MGIETKEYTKEEISDWKLWKWKIQDWTGLQIHKFIAWASSDPEVKQLYREMEEPLIQEGDQPKALRISQEIKSRIIVNTQEKASELTLR